MKRRILLVEDEPNLAQGLKLNLEIEGYEVVWTSSGASARCVWSQGSFDLVMLDRMLPDADGLDLLQEFKKGDLRQPVMILTARAADEDRISGLSLGADDYVTKPFNLQELMLRVRGMVRRGKWYHEVAAESIRIGECDVDTAQSVLVREGKRQLLTDLELRLLVHLYRRRGTYVSREELLTEVWGYAPGTATRTVDIFISRLRKMIGDDASSPRLLLTRRGQGYMLVGASGEGRSDPSQP